MIQHVSYSMYELYHNCRECLKYKYIQGLKGETPDYFADGREYHDAVDAYHTGRPYNETLIESYTKVFDKDFRKQSELWVEDLNGGNPVYLPGIKLPVKGKIDGITEDSIVDLKYIKGTISQRQADESGQATLYTYIYYTLTGKLLPFYFQTVNKETGRVSLIKTTRTPDKFTELAQRFNDFIAEVEMGDFTPIPGHTCHGFCEYINICSACGANL